jgi:hypothetical protein
LRNVKFVDVHRDAVVATGIPRGVITTYDSIQVSLNIKDPVIDHGCIDVGQVLDVRSQIFFVKIVPRISRFCLAASSSH